MQPKFYDEEKGKHLFEETKEILKLNINTVNDDPAIFANNRAYEIFGDMLQKQCIYKFEDVNELDYEHLKYKYQDMIDNMAIDFFVVGDVDDKQCLAYFNEQFSFKPRIVDKQLVYVNKRNNFDDIVEYRQVTQSNLVQLYSCNRTSISQDYASMIVGNGIFGLLPTSLLFQEVREKNSLCYSIFSDYKIYDGIIRVGTSFDIENLSKIKLLIEEQLNKMKNGEFSDELLETTKQMYINNYRQSEDSIASLMWNAFRESIMHDNRTTAKIIEDIQNVTKDSIKAAFNDVELKLTYVLAQKGDNYD